MRKLRTPAWGLALVVAALLAGNSEVARATGNFLTVTLPKGVSLQIPKNWVVFSNNQRITLDTVAESNIDLSRLKQETSELGFAANYYDDRRETIGILNVRYYPELDISQSEAGTASREDVLEIDAALKDLVPDGLKTSGLSIASWSGTSKAEINGLTAFVTEYRRTSLKHAGDFCVRLVRVFAGARSFTLTVSYLDSESVILRPITDRIISSLKLSGLPDPARATTGTSGGENSGSSPAVSGMSAGGHVLVFAFSLLLTWGLGLTPPLILRFALLRRPIGKFGATAVAAVLFFVNLLVFAALGSQSKTHAALILVGLASYSILRYGPSKPSSTPATHSTNPPAISP